MKSDTKLVKKSHISTLYIINSAIEPLYKVNKF